MKYHTQANEKLGFSLVELSIVLVILGLLVGGILSGQTLIRASELRSVGTEYQRYATAIGTFRDKYFALPGDMSNATSFWASSEDGDGDGNIEGNTTAAQNETGYFWEQLARAALVEGSYTPASWAAISAPTTNPKAKMNPATWNIKTVGSVLADDAVCSGGTEVCYEGSYGNAFFLMGGTDLSAPTGGVLKSEEAWNIDTKMDDGKPQSGMVTSFENQGGGTAGSRCGNAASATTATAVTAYDLTSTSNTQCSLIFKSGY